MESQASFVRSSLGFLGGRLAVLAVVMLACGWLIMGPLTVSRHATEDPFRVDYLAFDTAAQIIRNGESARLYDLELQRAVQADRSGHADDGFTAYMNPPIVGAAFLPFTPLSARAGYVATAVVLAATMAVVFALMLRILDDVPRLMRWAAALCVAGSTATASALISGQLTPVLLMIALSSVLLFRLGRAGSAGIALGLLCIKPHFAAGALIVLLLSRQWKAAAYMMATMVAGALASLAIVGPSGLEGYISLMRQSFADPASVFIDVRSEQNLRGLVATIFRVYGGLGLDLASNGITLAVLGAVAFAIARTPYVGRERAFYITALGAMLICGAAPHIQYYDMALLALPALFIVSRAAAASPAVRPRFFGVLVLLVLWIEIAGTLAGAKMSVSVVPLLGFVAAMCWWPRVEAWLVADAGSPVVLVADDSALRAAA